MNGPAVEWVKGAVRQELRIIDDDGTFPVRYMEHKDNGKTSDTRLIIESKQGTLARMLERNGKPLTPEQNAAERERLQEILDHPNDWLKRKKRNEAARTYAMDLIRLLPESMIYSYAPGQPQAPNAKGPQIVLDFKPNPAFHPPTTIAQLLTGLEGRMWIDVRSQCLTRAEARVVQPVNFGWGGLLARIYPGGTVEFEQAEAGSGRWLYSHLDENISIREVLIHTAVERNKLNATDIRLLPAPIDYRDAIAMLLAEPLPH